MRMIVILWRVLSAIIGCGSEIRNSPPVVDRLIIPEEKGIQFSYDADAKVESIHLLLIV